MSGKIQDEDIALVRDQVRIEQVIGAYVALRNAGGGSLKGLCPFHDEKTPSFTVSPTRGLYYCFGCGEGGDVFTFLQKHENISFVEAVQQLADQTGIQLRYSDFDTKSSKPGLRMRILEANRAAEEFFIEQLFGKEAISARQFLSDRGFTAEHAKHFSIGYAPRDGRSLTNYLRKQGFSDEELRVAGLSREGGRDFFVGRVLWPIHDTADAVLGFGARRIHEDDRLPAKYINTPETPVYKKSHVLYGLNLARKAIGKKSQAVVVEGYTDVMAAHISGVETAVASCGTAFGEDHARLLQRLMGNTSSFHGEVIFTFDGDAAGQAAAQKVFKLDQGFISQTYVAIEPSGLDPCDLLMRSGPAAVRELIGRRVALYRFVMGNVLKKYDLDRADGQLEALREAAGLLPSIRDGSMVNAYIRELASLVGMDIDVVRREVAQSRRRRGISKTVETNKHIEKNLEAEEYSWPNPKDPALEAERGVLKLMLQYPELFDVEWNQVKPEFFNHLAYQEIVKIILATKPAQQWAEIIREKMESPILSKLVVALSVEPVAGEPSFELASQYAARIQLNCINNRIKRLKSKLQRINPITYEQEYKELFNTLLSYEKERKYLQGILQG